MTKYLFKDKDYKLLSTTILKRNSSSDEIDLLIEFYKEQTINFDESKLYYAIETHPLSLNDEGKITNAN